LIGMGAAGYQLYRKLAAREENIAQRAREIISIQWEQTQDLQQVVNELDDVLVLNHCVINDAEADLRELERSLHEEARGNDQARMQDNFFGRRNNTKNTHNPQSDSDTLDSERPNLQRSNI
ncbi:MAG: hypothetical protein M3R00_03205, partial [Pseudomonadota bacterium]|nr:hypothetical protein [Pseudomonadota bacterium]